MTDFDAIDALLAQAREEAELPSPQRRRELREGLGLSRAQVAGALGVSPSTVGGWETGRDPAGGIRDKYAYFLEGAEAKLRDRAAAAVAAEGPGHGADGSDGADLKEAEAAEEFDEADEADEAQELAAAQPCVLCGHPATHQMAGFPQHLDPAECEAAARPRPEAPAPEAPVHEAPVHEAPTANSPAPGRESPPRAPEHQRRTTRTTKVVPVGRRAQAASDVPDLIGHAVHAALTKHQGDSDAAGAELLKNAIRDAMALLDECRKGGRYDIVAHPPLPDVLRKKSKTGPDEIWEARPKWTRPELPAGRHEVTALDINGAYLSALKTHLPIGALEYGEGDHHDRRRAGVHLITPPEWDHDALLPNPIGNRDEPGPLWVTEPTLRLLLRCSQASYGLCDRPVIHESWTSGATEGLLEKFRVALKDARDAAIAEDDEVTLEYVKAMYSKFVSTMGESNYNRELYRPDWMHLIRSQAFANLWMKAYKAYDEGLTVVRAMGTDELHVIGDWQHVFAEGRGVTEVKVKDVYAIGTGPQQDLASEDPVSDPAPDQG
ncbi:helix-turn-helix domain-containing protein [Actinomycetota bacterium Odt1-20B]